MGSHFKHGGVHAALVLKKELRALHPNHQAAGSEKYVYVPWPNNEQGKCGTFTQLSTTQ